MTRASTASTATASSAASPGPNRRSQTRRNRGLATLGLVVTALVGVVAAIGVFGRGDGSTRTFTSVRGEVYEVVTNGVYAHNAERYVAEGIGWDLVTLFLVVPAMLAVLPAVARGSLRARLFAVGVLAYFFYQYFMYAMALAVGPLLLPYVAIYAASLVGIAWTVSTIDLDELASRVSERFPRRALAVFCAVMAALLCGLWIPRVFAVLAGDLEGNLHGQTTMVIDAMDLGLVVPLAMATAVLVWRRRRVGYLLGSIVVVKGFAMAAAITAMVLSAWAVEGQLELGGLVIFVAAAVASMGLIVALYRSIDDRREVAQ